MTITKTTMIHLDLASWGDWTLDLGWKQITGGRRDLAVVARAMETAGKAGDTIAYLVNGTSVTVDRPQVFTAAAALARVGLAHIESGMSLSRTEAA